MAQNQVVVTVASSRNAVTVEPTLESLKPQQPEAAQGVLTEDEQADLQAAETLEDRYAQYGY